MCEQWKIYHRIYPIDNMGTTSNNHGISHGTIGNIAKYTMCGIKKENKIKWKIKRIGKLIVKMKIPCNGENISN